MKVIILNGPMGIGKTTVGTCIADKHPGTAFIDGDWCIEPWGRFLWLKMSQRTVPVDGGARFEDT